MTVELEGAVQLRLALKRFDTDLSKETQSEMAAALRGVTAVAKGFIPSNGDVLSGWLKVASGDNGYRPFPEFDAGIAKAGITYSTSPSKPNRNGFVALARILNKSAGGAIYETAGRENLHGREQAGLTMVLNPRHANYGKMIRSGSKTQGRSTNPNAGRQFVDNLNSTGKLVNARPKGLVGRPTRKQTGRVIFRAWAEDNGVANAAIIKAIEKSSALFYEHTKRAA